MKREDMLCRVSGVLLKCADLIFAALFAFVVVRVTWNTQSMIPGSIGRYITMCFLWIILVGCCVFCGESSCGERTIKGGFCLWHLPCKPYMYGLFTRR